jgi:8-amino-7-oxononanoate synthase
MPTWEYSAVYHKRVIPLSMIYFHMLQSGRYQLSKAESFPFQHNDLDDLERRLKTVVGTVYIVTESLFSMDGDLAPLVEMVQLCERFGAFL